MFLEDFQICNCFLMDSHYKRKHKIEMEQSQRLAAYDFAFLHGANPHHCVSYPRLHRLFVPAFFWAPASILCLNSWVQWVHSEWTHEFIDFLLLLGTCDIVFRQGMHAYWPYLQPGMSRLVFPALLITLTWFCHWTHKFRVHCDWYLESIGLSVALRTYKFVLLQEARVLTTFSN